MANNRLYLRCKCDQDDPITLASYHPGEWFAPGDQATLNGWLKRHHHSYALFGLDQFYLEYETEPHSTEEAVRDGHVLDWPEEENGPP